MDVRKKHWEFKLFVHVLVKRLGDSFFFHGHRYIDNIIGQQFSFIMDRTCTSCFLFYNVQMIVELRTSSQFILKILTQ